jgi:hypothetical protein
MNLYHHLTGLSECNDPRASLEFIRQDMVRMLGSDRIDGVKSVMLTIAGREA